MTLFEVIRTLEHTAAMQPDVRTIVRNDIYRLNAAPKVKYGVFAWLQEDHTFAGGSDLQTFGFTLFYADRLTDGASNEVEIQSTGVEVLQNIIRQLDGLGIVASGDVTIRAFNERFSDACAGAYARVRFEVPVGWLCGYDYKLPEKVEYI